VAKPPPIGELPRLEIGSDAFWWPCLNAYLRLSITNPFRKVVNRNGDTVTVGFAK